MKKLLCTILAVTLLATLPACGAGGQAGDTDTASAPESAAPTASEEPVDEPEAEAEDEEEPETDAPAEQEEEPEEPAEEKPDEILNTTFYGLSFDYNNKYEVTMETPEDDSGSFKVVYEQGEAWMTINRFMTPEGMEGIWAESLMNGLIESFEEKLNITNQDISGVIISEDADVSGKYAIISSSSGSGTDIRLVTISVVAFEYNSDSYIVQFYNSTNAENYSDQYSLLIESMTFL